MNAKSLTRLTARNFENLVYDLLVVLGMRNISWRTPGRDSGRDIEGIYYAPDISGSYVSQNWYVECKKYKTSVSWPTVREKLSYAEANSADCLLFVTSSSLSPQCLDNVQQWNASHARPQVRHWGGHDISTLLERTPSLLVKYGFQASGSDARAQAILTLSNIAMKYVHSAHAASVFGGEAAQYLEAAAAISDLMSRKLDQLQSHSSLYPEAFRPEEDGYAWMTIEGAVPSCFDRHVLRAICAVVRNLSDAHSVTLRATGELGLALSTQPTLPACSTTQQSDLFDIAFWGDLELTCDTGSLRLNGRRH